MTQTNKARSPIRREILGFFFHVPLAMVFGTLAGMVLAFLLNPILSVLVPFRLPILGFFKPIYWICSVPLGILTNYRAQHRSARYVFAFGIVYLLIALSSYIPNYGQSSYFRRVIQGPYLYHALHMLFSNVCKDGQCLEQMLVTLPFLNSIAYSVGAWFGLRFFHEAQKPLS
jgi:hypothetical protein